MDEKRYYQGINNIRSFETGEKVNGNITRGFITLTGIPFFKAGDAVKYAMEYYPDHPPEEEIRYDPKGCRITACSHDQEIKYMISLIENQIAAKKSELDLAVKKRDDPNTDYFEKERAKDQILELVSYSHGLFDAMEILSKRSLDLLNCRYIKT